MATERRLTFQQFSKARALLWLVVAAFLPFVSACTNECRYNGDCQSGLVCVARQCVAPTNGADHCPGGQDECSTAEQCTSLKCNDGCCSPPCTGNADCAVTETCQDGACKPLETPTGCQRNADCTAPNGFCLPATNTCVECRSTADCGSSHKTCSLDTHSCIYTNGACGADDDCASIPSIPKCDVAQNLCVGCLTTSDCGANEICSELQTCVAAPPQRCTQESDCVGNPHGLVHCSVDDNLCVRCTSSSQCPGSQICRAHACVPPSGCQSDAYCSSSSAPYCNLNTGVCVGCFDSSQCTMGFACRNQTCTTCTSDAECEQSSAGPACRLDSGRCSQCNESSDCTREGATCNANHQCEGGLCAQDADCANSPTGSYCVAGACVGCRTSDQCSGTLSCFHNKCQNPICDTDDDCATAVTGPHCDVTDHSCYPCALNSQCPRTLTCQSHRCALLSCATDPDCAIDETAQYCDSQTQICVECAADRDCPPGLQCVAGSCGDHSTCNHGDCGTMALCVPIPVNDYTDWTERCVPQRSGAAGGGPCHVNTDCASGQCYHVEGNNTDGICLDTCATSGVSGCATGAFCPPDGVTLKLPGPDGVINPTAPNDDAVGAVSTCWPAACTKDSACAHKGFPVNGTQANRVCGPTPNPMDPMGTPLFSCLPQTGFVVGGMPCFDNSDCQSNICLPWTDSTMRTTGRCFSLCALDADCPTVDHATASCKDVSVNVWGATLPLKSCIFRP